MAMPTTGIFLQEACYKHRFIRSRDTSAIVERPQRLRAVTTGLACAIARLEEQPIPDTSATAPSAAATDASLDPDELASQLGRLDLRKQKSPSPTLAPAPAIAITHSTASLSLLNNPAVKYVHGDIDGDVYLENLVRWVAESKDKAFEQGESEIPAHLSQGDLYLCPESLDAIQGALGTVCEAVDAVITPNNALKRAFVAVRPPGHHCGEDTPSGFCFVNNVAVAAAHAHLTHGIDRVVVFDIDLHHGNGTQSIVWQINEETYRQTLETEGGGPPTKLGPRIYYGSIHDILSYPCEDGKPALVQAASTSLNGAHGQYIENVHLQEYTSPEHFEELYTQEYSKILRRAEAFLDATGGPGNDVLFFISCGMDASEHEMPSMSRHNRRVPTAFFHRFARDARALADKYAAGRIISVLEGGYSDRALASGAMAHLLGLGGEQDEATASNWWSEANLLLLEKATKKPKRGGGGRASLPPRNAHPWLDRTLEIFATLDRSPATAPRRDPPPSSRTLRDRKGLGVRSASSSAVSSPAKALPAAAAAAHVASDTDTDGSALTELESDGEKAGAIVGVVLARGEEQERNSKLPRVILKLGPAPGTAA